MLPPVDIGCFRSSEGPTEQNVCEITRTGQKTTRFRDFDFDFDSDFYFFDYRCHPLPSLDGQTTRDEKEKKTHNKLMTCVRAEEMEKKIRNQSRTKAKSEQRKAKNKNREQEAGSRGRLGVEQRKGGAR